MNSYYRIWNDKDILETDKDFQDKLVKFEDFANDFFGSREIKVSVLNKIGTDTYILNISYLSQKYYILFLNVKNSGMAQSEVNQYKKRLQISNKLYEQINSDCPVFVIGGYKVGSQNLYFVSELSDFIKQARQGDSYSSFWIDYYEMRKTYEKSENVWRNTRNKLIYGISSNKLRKLSTQDLITKLFIADESVIETKTQDDYESTDIPLFDENKHANIRQNKLLPRNPALKELAIKRENYTCELCGIQHTFTTNSNEEYFEGHHLIMYNLKVQQRYKYCLDILDNIVCLCPNCHKKIHYATDEDRRNMVLELLVKHNKLMTIFENLDIDDVLNDYINGGSDDE